MENQGELWSFDLYEHKVEQIRSGASRLHLNCLHASVRDAAAPQQELALADRVLCDAPCSGLGTIWKKPEIRYKSQEKLDNFPDLQYRILCESAKLVKEGGILIYSTCTLNPQENAGVADRFAAENPGFLPLALPLPIEVVRCVEEPENQLTLMPQMLHTDGFFIAAFVRGQGAPN